LIYLKKKNKRKLFIILIVNRCGLIKIVVKEIKFINNTTGFLTNLQEKNIFYTTNGGSNWIYSIIGSNVGLIDMFLNNQGLGITVGYRGKIYRTTNLGGIIGINNNNEIIPNDFELFQNYPNPFNPSTKIKYQIKTEVRSQGSEVKLIIFDILGREIETMVNSKQKPGIYEVTFDGNNLSSGIYFYRIVVGDFASVKRMVLIK